MKNCKELNFDLAHYYYEKENVLYCKGRTVLTDYKRNLRLDISENFTDTETKLYIFGTEKGLYSFGKYLIDYSAWDCWYDGAHQHYDNIRNRNNVPFINLIIHKLKNIDYIDKKSIFKNIKTKIYYTDDWKDKNGIWHYGNVFSPKYTDEIVIDIFDETDPIDDEFDEFFRNGKFQVNLTASDRAMRELGKYLINVSMFKTKNKNYIGTIKNVASNGDSKISICVSKIWKTPKEIEQAHNSYKKYGSYHIDD